MKLVDSLFSRSVWSGLPIVTHSHASDSEIDKVLHVLRKISPLVGDHLKIDFSNIKKHPELHKVMDNHTRGSAYFHQFFKKPLVAPCDCIPCKQGMSSSLIMPIEAYEELHSKLTMPLPIPKPTIDGVNDFHYISFEEAVTHPFTAEHQPSLQNWRQTNNKAMGELQDVVGRLSGSPSPSITRSSIAGSFVDW